jgi:hypothetical protein
LFVTRGYEELALSSFNEYQNRFEIKLPMRISYVTTYNALDVHNWSGNGYHIAKALADQNNEIEYAGDLEMKSRKLLKVKELF